MDMQPNKTTSSSQALMIVSDFDTQISDLAPYSGLKLDQASPDIKILLAEDEPGIDEMRQIKRFLNTRPIHLEQRVVVIFAAERLNHISQNSLLKILEEPPSYAQLFLVTSNPLQLLETVRSRLASVFLNSHSSGYGSKVEAPEIISQIRGQDNLGDKMVVSEKFSKKEVLLTELKELISWNRHQLLDNPDKQNLFNLTASLYCWQLLHANVNPKSITDFLALRLKV